MTNSEVITDGGYTIRQWKTKVKGGTYIRFIVDVGPAGQASIPGFTCATFI